MIEEEEGYRELDADLYGGVIKSLTGLSATTRKRSFCGW